MEDSSLPRLVLRGAVHGAALGLLIGGLEALPLGVLVTAPLGFVGIALLCIVAAVSFSVAGFAVAFVVGWPVHWLLQRVVVSRGLALQLALTGLILIGYLFGGFALDELNGGRPAAAGFLAGLPVFLFVAIFLLSGRLYRMSEMGQRPVVGFWPVAVGGAIALMAVGIGLNQSRDTGGRGALPSDPRVVVIAVDGLRADMGGADVPRLEALASSGWTFSDAITPMPSPAPAIAAVLTGLPPAQNQVLRQGDRLPRAKGLLSRTFAEEGYAAGGFVSDTRLGDRWGFGYGFQVYDALQDAPVAGLDRERLWGDLGGALGLFGARRSASSTVDRAVDWMESHAELPFFALIHMSDPHFDATPADGIEERELARAYRTRVAEVDRQVGRVLDAVDRHGLTDNTVIVVTGTSGVSLGEGGAWGSRGLTDASVHVPLIVRVPGVAEGEILEAQVRLQDLFPTLLDHAEITARHQPEALPLQGLADGSRERGLAAVLTARTPDGAWWVGVRSGGRKYGRRLDTGEEFLFDLDDDPDELRDIAGDRPQALAEERAKVQSQVRRVGSLLEILVAPAQ